MAERELAIVGVFCKPEMDSIDVGAYEGIYTKEVAKISNIVLAFEPIPQRFNKLLGRRYVKNKNVIVYPYALSNSDGLKTLYIPRFKNRFHKEYLLHAMASLDRSNDSYYSNSSRNYLKEEKLIVKSKKLDYFQRKNVGFIKIDVEGHEEAVLSGAEATLESSFPHLLIEIEERYNLGGIKRIKEWLGKKGYSGFFIHENNLFSIEKFNVNKMQIRPLVKINNRITSIIPGYINNFIFIHKNQTRVLDPLLNQLRKNQA